MSKILLSPVSETEHGLMSRNFYLEPVGFGVVSETHENDPHLSNVNIQLPDWRDGSKKVGSYVDPELIKDDERLKEFISFFVAVCMRG